MPTLIIDNREITVPENTKVIDAAEKLGIVIPRFCYHPALGSVGACRICAVGFKAGPFTGVQMSCMVDAQDEMVVDTADPEAMDFRKHVIEWLMLHHPHDCPVCDEGGHCLLQDTTVSGGHGLRRYQGKKRTHVDQDLGLLVSHEMNRCIQCYRCARYYQEFTGYRDLGVLGIGSRVYYGRSKPGRLESPFTGNLIDICPTGVYTDRPSRFKGRRWEFERSPSICLHCSLGCGLIVSARYRKIVRHEAGTNPLVNGHFICDRGRYGYAWASAGNRPRRAMNSGESIDTADALRRATRKLRAVSDQYGPESVAAVGAMESSLETLAVLKSACRLNQWTGPAVASTRREVKNLASAVSLLKPETAVSLQDIAGADTALVFGADPLNEAPMLALSLRQVDRRGGWVAVFDPRPVDMPLSFDHQPVHPSELGRTIEELIQAVSAEETVIIDDPATKAPGSIHDLALRLKQSRRPVIICGTDIVTSREIQLAADLAENLRVAGINNAGLFYTLSGANAFAAGLAADSDGPAGIDHIIDGIEKGDIRALVAVENDLWHRFPRRSRLTAAIERLELFILVGHAASPLNDLAHFFFPAQTVYETGGRWINQEGRLQVAEPAFVGGEPIEITGGRDHPPRTFRSDVPGGGPEPAWRIVAALAGIKAEGNDPEQPLEKAIGAFHPATGDPIENNRRIRLEKLTPAKSGQDDQAARPDDLTLLLADRTFGTEPFSSRADVLVRLAEDPTARMHPNDIERLGLAKLKTITISSDGETLTLPLKACDAMSSGVILIPRLHGLDWRIFEDTRVAIDPNRITDAVFKDAEGVPV